MKEATLVLVFNDKREILLCMKKRSFGIGKYNGAGGKVNPGETIIEAAIRELKEETGIIATELTLEKRGILHFYWTKTPDWDQNVHMFVMKNYTGNFEETEEMRPEWFSLDNIPYDQMWEDDATWLPEILTGKNIEYNFYFDDNGKINKIEKIL